MSLPVRILFVSAMLIFSRSALSDAPSPCDGFNPNVANCTCLKVQPDGKIVAVDRTYKLRRINPDGSLDGSFYAQTSYMISCIELQPDGKILIGGAFRSVNNETHDYIARLNPDGSIDSAFHPIVDGAISQIIVQPSGKMYIAGRFTKIEGIARRYVACLNADGTFDSTFSPAMVFIAPVACMVLQPDGKILVATQSAMPLYRFNADGTEDPSFHPAGPDITDTYSYSEMILQPDGKILLHGGFNSDVTLRLNANGSLDTAYRPVQTFKRMLCLQSDGKLLVFGTWSAGGREHRGIMRLNPDGSSDDSYHYELGHEVWGFGMQKDGKIVLSGDSAYLGSIYVYERVLRLNPDGTLDKDLDFAVNPDHTIRTIARQSDGKTVIGGDFDNISGFPRNRIARLNPDNTLDLSFNPGPGTNGCILGLGIQPDGKVVITGDFTLVAGVARAGIARLNVDGSLDAAFNPEVNGAISQIAMRPSGDFYIRGLFTSINGTTRNYVARLKAAGSLDASFTPSDSTTIPSCIAAQPDGKVLIGSSETGTSGKYAKMVRLNANGTIDTAFDPQFASGLLGVTKIVVLNEGGILAAASGPGSNEVKLSCFNSDGTSAALYRCDKYVLRGSIDSIAEQADGKLLIGGIFETVPNESEQLGGTFDIFARLNTDGMPDVDFKGAFAPNNNVRAIVVRPDGKIMIGGDFASYNGAPRNRLALLNEDGSLTTASLVASAPDGEVNAVATGLDGGIIIGGGFSSIYQSPRTGAARLNAGGDVNSTFTTNLRDVSVVAALPGGKLLVCDRPSAGSETHVITRHKADGTTDSSFARVVVDGRVDCMSVQADGAVIIAGGFHHVKGFVLNQIARLNANGGVDHSFNAGDGVDLGEIVLPDDDGSEENHNEWLYHQSRGAINSTAVQPDGKIMIAGHFDRAGGVDRKNIARLNANGSHDASFDPGSGTDGKVFAVALQPDGKALIAGEFTKVDGKTRNGIARLNPDGSVDGRFIPETAEFNYFHSLSLQSDGKILMAGFYSSEKGYGRVARLNADGSFDTLFETPEPLSFAFAGVRAIALQDDGKLLAGGVFNKFGSIGRRNFARVSNPTAAFQSLVVAPGGAGITWRLGGSYPQPYQALFEESADGVNWTALGWGTAVPGVGFAITHQRLPILTNHYVRATGWSTGGLGNGSVSIHRSTLNFYSGSYNATLDWGLYN